jgi:galactokinase
MPTPLDTLLERDPDLAARGAEVRVVRAPGRVNLIGEHTDYNEGFVFPAAIDLEIRIAYVPSDDGHVRLTRHDTGEQAEMAVDADRPADGSWFDYIAGVIGELRAAGHRPQGLRGVIDSSLPMNAGLSSSAAIEMASVWALLGDAAADVPPMDLARLAQRAENRYVGVNSGLMDQFASACGVAGAALLLDCRSREWRPVPLPDDVWLVVLHSGSPRRLAGSEYNVRRAQCEAGVAAIAKLEPGVRSLRDVTPAMLDAAADHLEPVVLKRCRHVVAENERVGRTVDALGAGDLRTVGEMFAASHASLRDLYEVSSPELDALVEIASSLPGVIAARMTGAGFGGCTVNLVRPGAVDELRAVVERDYPSRTGLIPRVFPVKAAAGAGIIA